MSRAIIALQDDVFINGLLLAFRSSSVLLVFDVLYFFLSLGILSVLEERDDLRISMLVLFFGALRPFLLG